MARKALVIGTETLSRVLDMYDRDSMIFSDGAGASVLEYKNANHSGVLGYSVQSHCMDEAYYLYMGKSIFRIQTRGFATSKCTEGKCMNMP